MKPILLYLWKNKIGIINFPHDISPTDMRSLMGGSFDWKSFALCSKSFRSKSNTGNGSLQKIVQPILEQRARREKGEKIPVPLKVISFVDLRNGVSHAFTFKLFYLLISHLQSYPNRCICS